MICLTGNQKKSSAFDVFTFDDNRQILTYIAKHWERLTTALGPEILERLSRHADEWWCWDHLAPYVSESSSLRNDFLSYCSRETTALPSRAIEALARESPKSHLLREHCFRCLANGPQNNNLSPFDHRRRDLIVGRVLGRQFSGEKAIRDQLEEHIMRRPSAAIVGLSIAWKESPALVAQYDSLRASQGQGTRYLWPDAAYLASTLGSREQFCHFLGWFLESCTGYLWDFLPFCIQPIVGQNQVGGRASLDPHSARENDP